MKILKILKHLASALAAQNGQAAHSVYKIRFWVFACLILRLSPAWGLEFYTAQSFLFNKTKSEPCAIVKVHSLSETSAGKVFHQEGIGWIVQLDELVNVLTPYHVVVNATSVYAECRGKFYELKSPLVSPEKDLARFTVDSQTVLNGELSPLIMTARSEEKAKFDLLFDTEDGKKQAANFNIRRKDLKDMQSIMLGMDSFGVFLPAEKSQLNSLFLSSIGEDLIQGFVEKDQSPIKQLIRIENFGIKPGLSGAPLFGILDMSVGRAYNVSRGMIEYQAPVEMMPKVILGMVTKTKMNGAETVAISLPDIYDFLETSYVELAEQYYGEGLRVHYAPVGEDEDLQLRSFLILKNETQRMKLQEMCSDEYKNSADMSRLKNVDLQKKLKDASILTDTQKELVRSLLKDSPLKIGDEKLAPMKSKLGGGEYGEGGDGFSEKSAAYLTSNLEMAKYKLPGFGKFLESVPSLGLYLKQSLCKQQGLWQGSKLINSLRIPGKASVRLATYEDVKRLFSVEGKNSLALIRDFGTYDTTPYFTQELAAGDALDLSLISAQWVSSNSAAWQPGGNQTYFKEKKILGKGGANSVVSFRANRFLLNTTLKGMSADNKNVGWVQILYENNTWNGRFALDGSCSLQLDPAKFYQINPWQVEYIDEGTQLSIEFGARGRLVAVNFKKVACPSFSKLALGELEVYSAKGLSPVIDTHRTALIPETVDLKTLVQKYRGGGL